MIGPKNALRFIKNRNGILIVPRRKSKRYKKTNDRDSYNMLQQLKLKKESSSLECQHSWKFNGVSYRNCTMFAQPGMCICATKVDNSSKELKQWKNCSEEECSI